MPPKLTEADVLFELFLPLLCESRAEAMAHFKGCVHFFMRAEEPRSWTVTGGAKPWLRRGMGERRPDVIVSVSEELVRDLVRGNEASLATAFADGKLAVKGDLKVLEAFEMTLADVSTALTTMLARNKQ